MRSFTHFSTVVTALLGELQSGRSPRFRAVSSFPSVSDHSSRAAAQAGDGAAAPAPSCAAPPAAAAAATPADAASDGAPDAEAEDELEPDAASLTVPVLKAELERLGLPVTGRKPELVKRLKEAQVRLHL